MIRRFLALALASVLLAACSTSKPPQVNPATDPTIVGSIDEAALEGSAQGAAGARTGRRIGQVAGVLAAVFGGPQSESVDCMVDRYRRTRDAAEAAGAIIGTARGASAGAKRGLVFDVQFAELHGIEGVDAVRPFPDVIEARFASLPSQTLLASVAAVFEGREERAIDVEAAGSEALDIRDALVDLGVPAAGIAAYRNDELRGVVVRVRYRS